MTVPPPVPELFGKPRRLPSEPVERLARLAWERAPNLCAPARGCANYHRVWGALRALDLGGVAPAGEGLYRYGLAPLREQAGSRVLISGGADAGLLALATECFAGAGQRPTFVFADICATPCALAREYATHAGLDLEIVQGDIRTIETAPVHAILAHSFLQFVGAEGWGAMAANWVRLLAPGGRIILTNKLNREPAERRAPGDPARREARARRLAPLARDLLGLDDEGEEAFVAAASNYAITAPGPRASEAGVRSLLSSLGLSVELVAYDVQHRAPGPTTAREPSIDPLRAGIIARKP